MENRKKSKIPQKFLCVKFPLSKGLETIEPGWIPSAYAIDSTYRQVGRRL